MTCGEIQIAIKLNLQAKNKRLLSMLIKLELNHLLLTSCGLSPSAATVSLSLALPSPSCLSRIKPSFIRSNETPAGSYCHVIHCSERLRASSINVLCILRG